MPDPTNFLGGSFQGGSNMAAGSAAAGTVISDLGDIFGGLSEEQGLFAQADRYRQQASLDLYQGGLEVQQNERQAVADISGANAAAGAEGVTGSGSPHQAVMESINQANTADAAARFGAKVKSNTDLYAANVQDYEGKQAFMSGLVNAGVQTATTLAVLA